LPVVAEEALSEPHYSASFILTGTDRIKHVVVNEAWIRQGENRVLKVKDVIKG
jgi:hypothetical protein